MSEFVVYRTLGNGRCLVLDGTRIAGGKPDYRGNNYITSWVTDKTYGPVDELKSENAKLRKDLEFVGTAAYLYGRSDLKDLKAENAKLRELCEWLLEPYRLGAVTGEGVDRQWCRETYDGGSYRLRELGGEVN